MKIRMLTGISGTDFDLIPKQETDRFSDGEAVRLMLSDQAEPADPAAGKALAAARSDRDKAEAAPADAVTDTAAESGPVKPKSPKAKG